MIIFSDRFKLKLTSKKNSLQE